MTVEITYFGQLTDFTGRKSETHTTTKTTINELLEELSILYPLLKDSVFAVFCNNKKVADTSEKLERHSNISLMPPFAGG